MVEHGAVQAVARGRGLPFPKRAKGFGSGWWIELVALCSTHRVNVNRLHAGRHYRSPTEHEDDYHRQKDSQQTIRCRENPASTSSGARRQIRAERPSLTKR